MGKVFIIGTCDTKEAELLYARRLVEKAGVMTLVVDVSTSQGWVSRKADLKPDFVAAFHPRTPHFLESIQDRGAAVTAMGEALAAFLPQVRNLRGVLGLGGGGNTSIVTAAMRALPIGVPKLMVSTMASGNIAPYVGPSDIAMMYAVTDIAGLNAISRQVIGNAAHAIVGMAALRVKKSKRDKPGVGLTMFGVTTPCITQIRAALEKTRECFVFHATGTGGQSMEKLVDSGLLSAVIDITTTEVADFLCGGVLACTEDRLGAIIRTRIPYVGSVGALDMVNFGAYETIPDRFGGRRFHIHNPQVTLMRTAAEENRRIGEWIVTRLNRMEGPVRFLLPLGGISAIDAPGAPFHDPVADNVLFEAIRGGWQTAPNRKLIEVGAHVNDPAFAAAAVNAFKDIM